MCWTKIKNRMNLKNFYQLFLIMMIQLLFREWYDRLCIIQCDYTLTYLDWIQYESDDIVSPLATTRNETTLSSRFWSSSKASFDENTQYAITIAQLLVDLQGVICFKVGTTNPLEATKGKHTKKITTQFIALDTMLTEIVNDRRYAILLIGDAHLDKNNKYGSSIVFDSIATTLDRTVKSIGCKSPVWPLSFIVA